MNHRVVGFGIDITTLRRFKVKKFSRHFLSRFLTPEEIQIFFRLPSTYSQNKYLASLWSAKEATYKALNHIINLPLHRISLEVNCHNQLFYLNPENQLLGFVSVSFLHDKQVIAACLMVSYEQLTEVDQAAYWQMLKIASNKFFTKPTNLI